MRSVIELSCYIVLAQMWNLLAGYAGLVSVGQQAFIGVSGYAMFVLANKFGVNPLPRVGAVPRRAGLAGGAGLRAAAPARRAVFRDRHLGVSEACRLFTSTFDYVGAAPA